MVTNLSPEQLVLPAALLGVVSHLGYFIHGEHHNSNVKFLLLILFGPPALCVYLSVVKNFSVYESFITTATVIGAYVGSLTTSILIYRCFFHRLKHYPGPKLARMSKLWQTSQTITKYRTFELLDNIHAEYGDYVRTGPSEISVIDPEIVDAVYSQNSQCRKSQWYDMSLPITSLHQLRDRAQHDRRRRGGWDKAFNVKSLRAYDDRIIGYADSLLRNLDSFSGKPANVADWFNYYSYDVMGSLGFGRSFDTLKDGKEHKFIKLLHSATAILKCAGCIVYLTNLCTRVPSSMNPIDAFNIYSDDCVQERKRNKSAAPDILGHLIEAENFFGDPKRDRALLLGDSRLVIVAGSDTTAAALVFTFFYIAQDPSIVEKLRAELEEHGIRNDNSFSVPALQNLPYLNGVMNEGLRLHPPVPGGVFRMTPPEGLQVGEHFIPGDINVLVPTHSLQRSSKAFVRPDEFIPERWSTKPELVIYKNALMPFSAGVYGCIGKHLAMGELRTVISKIVLEFDVRLAPNETGARLFADQKDHFTLVPGQLDLCFVRRNQLN